MPTLHVIALGGTIASSSSDTSGGVQPSASADEIAAAAQLDTLPTGAPEVTFEQLAQVGSGSITLEILAEVARSARRAAARGACGIVLTQGTDTLEDSAFVLSLLNDSGIPIILTGAMRNPTLPGADGPANVRAAAIVALDPRIRQLPALAVFADEVHDPTFVRKAHTSSIAAFTSGPAAGPLGWVVEDRLQLPHIPAALALPAEFAVPEAPGSETSQAAEPSAHSPFPEVAHIEVGLGESLRWIDQLPDLGYAGAVLAGVGGGHVPASTVERVERLAGRIPVVLASRTGSGSTLAHTYGYPGAEIDLLSRGLIRGGRLDARKSRLLLTLALGAGVAPAAVFEDFG
ncbi:asparaginase [Brevibacterium daeguense]|uniref:Asparaginase n=1 Tax=Brevibacterium daeguense TaxID=909936 RepID=A0ABP8EK98_9MICO|nr:asparaginase domain-containing protein [Brevibacterium daeguense]